jgi:hypothetical protein
VLAFIFLLSTSLLFLLWHCRNAILARIIPQEEFDVEIGRAMHLPGEIYSGSFHSTSAAPAFVISRLPVFRYPGKAAAVDADANADAAGDTAATAAMPVEVGGNETAQKANHIQTQPDAGSSSSSGACVEDACDLAPVAKQPADGGEAAAQEKGCSQVAKQQPGPDVLATPDQDVQQQQQLGSKEGRSSSWITQLLASSHQQQRQQQLLQQHAGSTATSSSSSSRDTSRERPVAHQETDTCDTSINMGSSKAAELHQQQQQEADSDGVSSMHDDACIICFSDYAPGDLLKELPCKHYYHASCIDQWLTRSGNCPLCKAPVWQPCGRRTSNDSNAPQQQQQQQQADEARVPQELQQVASTASSAAAAAGSSMLLASSPHAAAA